MYVRKYLVLKVTKVQMQRDKDFVCIVSQARSKIFTVFHYGTQWIRLAVMWEENFSPDNVFSSALWQYGLSNFYRKDTKLEKLAKINTLFFSMIPNFLTTRHLILYPSHENLVTHVAIISIFSELEIFTKRNAVNEGGNRTERLKLVK